jgi:hypothetical protein
LAKAKQIYVQAKLKEKIFEQRECIAKKKPWTTRQKSPLLLPSLF